MIIFLGNTKSLKLYDHIISTSKTAKDIVVSCQYPHLVPKSLLEKYTCVNIHYGLLPCYAGCNPIYWQVLRDTQAGVTLHYMDENFDSGDIIDTFTIPIGNLNADEVYEQLAIAGKALFVRHYDGILHDRAPRIKQDLSKRRYYNKSDVNFRTAKHIYAPLPNVVRALHFEGFQYPQLRIGDRDYELRGVK